MSIVHPAIWSSRVETLRKIESSSTRSTLGGTDHLIGTAFRRTIPTVVTMGPCLSFGAEDGTEARPLGASVSVLLLLLLLLCGDVGESEEG